MFKFMKPRRKKVKRVLNIDLMSFCAQCPIKDKCPMEFLLPGEISIKDIVAEELVEKMKA